MYISDFDSNTKKAKSLSWSKIQQTKMLITCQRFDDVYLFGLVWLASCSSNITLSLPSH